MRALPRAGLAAPCLLAGALIASPAVAQETWVINEVFSNSDGTQQYVELYEAENQPGADGFAGLTISTMGRTCTFLADLPSSQTANEFVLLATAAFVQATGTGADFVIPQQFVERFDGDRINFASFDQFLINAGDLPTDGINSWNRSGPPEPDGKAPRSPMNFVSGGAGLPIRCPEPALALLQLAALGVLAGLARLRR